VTLVGMSTIKIAKIDCIGKCLSRARMIRLNDTVIFVVAYIQVVRFASTT
jgi:hypothetical protein